MLNIKLIYNFEKERKELINKNPKDYVQLVKNFVDIIFSVDFKDTISKQRLKVEGIREKLIIKVGNDSLKDIPDLRTVFKHVRKELLDKLPREYAPIFVENLDTLYNVFEEDFKLRIVEWRLKSFLAQWLYNIERVLKVEEAFEYVSPELFRFNVEKLYCPICQSFDANGSDYLLRIFDETHTYWIACLVTHYRHFHIRYYDRSWRYPWYREKNKEYTSHEEFKKKVNNRAKRQLIRAIMKDKNLTASGKAVLVESFKKLMYNDEKTEELITKSLEKLNLKR